MNKGKYSALNFSRWQLLVLLAVSGTVLTVFTVKFLGPVGIIPIWGWLVILYLVAISPLQRVFELFGNKIVAVCWILIGLTVGLFFTQIGITTSELAPMAILVMALAFAQLFAKEEGK